MAQINEPTPIKPIWPLRREQHPARRKPAQLPPDEQAEDHPPGQDKKQKRSGFDDYA